MCKQSPEHLNLLFSRKLKKLCLLDLPVICWLRCDDSSNKLAEFLIGYAYRSHLREAFIVV